MDTTSAALPRDTSDTGSDLPGLHATPCGAISVVLSLGEVILAVELELLLEREIIKLSTQGKLLIHFLLANVEPLHIKEACRGG